MTIDEASRQALRELGKSEEEIKARFALANTLFPQEFAEIEQGKEREAIEWCKQLFHTMQTPAGKEFTQFAINVGRLRSAQN